MRIFSKDVPAVRLPPNAVGMLTALEFALAFNDWATTPGQAVTPDTIRDRWGVSRATAYRYLRSWQMTQERRAA